MQVIKTKNYLIYLIDRNVKLAKCRLTGRFVKSDIAIQELNASQDKNCFIALALVVFSLVYGLIFVSFKVITFKLLFTVFIALAVPTLILYAWWLKHNGID